jgi:NAD(P)-dependent dehydrogenase (short-subunit alcohol dehydrogenase family)
MQHANGSRRTLAGRVALVTGAASGIGAATARRLAADGATVILADLSDAGERVAAEIGGSARFTRLDVCDPDQWARTVADIESADGRLDVLVNAAGILVMATIEDETLESWRRTIGVNLTGVYLGCRAAIPAMRRAGGGSIVNIASTSAVRGDADFPAYDASKGGVVGLTKEIAVHCGRRGDGIRCNSVIPGSVNTPMVNSLAGSEETDRIHRLWTEGLRAGRVADPSEIAAAVSFLASDASDFVTGSELTADGGTTA